MTNPAPIETLLAKFKESLCDCDRSFECPNRTELGLIEAFREVLGALKFYSDKQAYIAGSAKTEGFISKVEADDWGSRAREALARANEIASQALGETKS